MTVNKYKFKIPKNGDKYINIPVEIKWDFLGQDDSIDKFETEVIKEVIGSVDDFEVGRYAHDSYGLNGETNVKYDFHFFNGGNINSTTLSDSDWEVSYIAEGFVPQQVYYFEKPFTKSFFKLDFYDTKNPISQKNLFTVIIPVQQGGVENVQMSQYKPNVDIRKPSYSLDYVGDKEGFFLYWLRNPEYLDISTFYMTAKFFDGRLGVFVKMMNTPQSQILSKFVFEGSDYFYYDVNLDYDNKIYQVTNNVGNRVGTSTPINWYEYVNPQ